MELKPGMTKRRCHCGDSLFPVTDEDAARIDAGEAGIQCSTACWGKYLARNADKETGKL